MNAVSPLSMGLSAGAVETRALRWVAGLVCASLLIGGFWPASRPRSRPPP